MRATRASSSCSATAPILTVGDAIVHRNADRARRRPQRGAISTPPTAHTAPKRCCAMQPDVLIADPAVQLQSVLDRPPWHALRAVREHRVYILRTRRSSSDPVPATTTDSHGCIERLTPPRCDRRRHECSARSSSRSNRATRDDRSSRSSPSSPRSRRRPARRSSIASCSAATRRSGDARRQRQGARDRRARQRTRRRRAVGVQRPAPAPAHEPREDRAAADRRPHDADPRHLRAARALARRASCRSSSRSCAIGSPT